MTCSPVPPSEACSRVTNPERFRELHSFAASLLEFLDSSYDVRYDIGHGIDLELERVGVAMPTVRLTPFGADAAPLTVAFTSFPGLFVRFGRLFSRPFPACGCDACGETNDSESSELRWMVDQLVAGRFIERMTRDDEAGVLVHHTMWSEGRSMSGDRRLFDIDTIQPNGSDTETRWQAWPLRHRGASERSNGSSNGSGEADAEG